MDIIHAQSVSDALGEALYKVSSMGIREESRNGNVLVMPGPVTTVYYQPQKRVLFSPTRDANPFFHMMESLWMLAGKNDLLFPLLFNKRFREYSDDGATIWGAYGWRWREFFGYDQLKVIINELRKNPNSRRCVLSMWNAMPNEDNTDWHNNPAPIRHDLDVAGSGGKDVPCNTHAYFDCRGGALNMTVCNRSNDMIWGAYGANAVHFSILLEYMAAAIGVPVGVYRQISNNLHLYTDVIGEDKMLHLSHEVFATDRYTQSHRQVEVPAIVDCPVELWDADLKRFMARDGLWNDVGGGWNSRFFEETAVPMYKAHSAWRNKQYEEATEEASKIVAWDWRIASLGWLERREAKRKEKASA